MLNLTGTQTIRRRTYLVWLTAALTVLVSGSSVLAQRRARKTVKAMPAVHTVDAAGLQALLKRDDGKPLLVNYWATWCVPCREEFPDLVKLDSEYRVKGLDFIAVSLDDLADLKTGVPKFLSMMKARMPVYLLSMADPEPAIKAVDPKWGGALPATFLYNAKGELVYKSLDRVKVAELRAAIDRVLGEKQ